jgi:hypothetical protein
LTDFGLPVNLASGIGWTPQHDFVVKRMLKFYPPNVLALIKKIKVDQTNEMQTPLLLDEVLISDKHK